MAITADWQAEIRGLTMGALTNYPFLGEISGLGIPPVRAFDVERPWRHGAAAAVADILRVRQLRVAIGLDGTSPGNVMTLLGALRAAWAPVTAGEVPFDLRLPGQPVTVLRYYGRPRGVDPELGDIRAGWGEAMCEFDALDPLAYGAESTVTISATTGAVVNAGDFATDRISLVVTGDGGTPVVTNTTHGGAVTFTSALASGQTRTLDVRARTSSGAYSELVPSSEWFVLQPGSNILSLAGAASVAVTYRSAWL